MEISLYGGLCKPVTKLFQLRKANSIQHRANMLNTECCMKHWGKLSSVTRQ